MKINTGFHAPSTSKAGQSKGTCAKAKITEDQYKEACDEAKNFKSFLENEVFTNGTIMALLGGDPDVRYRDDYPG